MLKAVYFEGVIMVDMPEEQKENNYLREMDLQGYIRESIADTPDILDITEVAIKSLKDIPNDWKDCRPYGDREDDKSVIEIFNEDILPKLPPTENPNQKKFGFWEDAKKKT